MKSNAGFVVWGFAVGKIDGKERTKTTNRFAVEPDEIGAAVHAIVNDLSEFFGGGLDLCEINCRWTSNRHVARQFSDLMKGREYRLKS